MVGFALSSSHVRWGEREAPPVGQPAYPLNWTALGEIAQHECGVG
jgi:hypothetical protein